MFKDSIDPKVNVRIIARERGKKVPSLCREGHNIWVNQGRQYLAEVISPLNGSFAAHYNDSPVRFVRYMGLGIGGDSQVLDLSVTYPTLDTDYPGQEVFSDEDITVTQLERPVKVSGVAGVGSSAGVWMNSVTAPPAVFTGTPVTGVEFDALFDNADLNLAGAYPSVPVTEIGLFLSSEEPSRTSEEVYDYLTAPAYINDTTRQKLVAYNTFDAITKTVSVALEVHWQIQF
jgi:hypothetical protein